MSRVRVAFVQAWLPVGGAERIIETLVRRLDPARFESHLLNLYAPGPIGEALARDGVPTRSRLARGRLDPFAGARLEAALQEMRADVVHVFDSALPMLWAGGHRRRRPGVPLVLGFHSTVRVGGRLAFALADRVALPVVDRFVALTAAHRDLLADRLRLDRRRFTIIGTGVDLERFRPPADRDAARASFEFGRDEFVVALVAALRPEKHLELFVETARRLLAREPRARFLVAGDGPEAGALAEAVRAAGLGRAVRLLGPRQDVPAIWGAADAALLTSRTEALPVSLIEAHACGVPAVSTDVGSVAEIVVEGETGRLVPAGDAEGLAAALAALAADPVRRRTMAAAARARAEARHGLARMVGDYERLFATAGAGS